MITPYSNTISVTTVLDPDALAFFARVTAAGGTLSATEQTATNQLVLDLKANSLWTPMKAIYPMVGASAAACAQNLKSSSFTGTFTATGWTFASSGITSNGSSAYFDTTCRVVTDLTNFDLSWAHSGSTGSWNGAFSSNVVGFNSSAQIGLQNLTSVTGTIPASFRMMSGSVNSSGSNDAILYFDGTQQSVYTANSMSTDIGFILGALNTGTFPTVTPIIFNIVNISTLTLGSKLNGTQMSNLYTAVNTFNTSLSR